jgi:hypothetical protein
MLLCRIAECNRRLGFRETDWNPQHGQGSAFEVPALNRRAEVG